MAVQDCLEGMTAQQEMVKQLVSALEDAARGRGAGLTNLLAEFSNRAAGRPSKEDHHRLKVEVHLLLRASTCPPVCCHHCMWL